MSTRTKPEGDDLTSQGEESVGTDSDSASEPGGALASGEVSLEELTEAKSIHELALAAVGDWEAKIETLLEKAGQGAPNLERQLAEARAGLELADRRSQTTAADLEAVKARVLETRQEEFAFKAYNNPYLNGSALRDAAESFVSEHIRITNELGTTIERINAEQSSAAVEAEELQIVPASDNNLIGEPSIYVPYGDFIAVVPGKGVALSGKPFEAHNRFALSRALVEGTITPYPDGSTNRFIRVAELPPTSDARDVDGCYGRRLLGTIFGIPGDIRPLGECHILRDSEDGVWARIDNCHANEDGTIELEAFVLARGFLLGKSKNNRLDSDPWHIGELIISKYHVGSKGDAVLGGRTVTVTLIDTTATQSSDDPAVVADAARVALEGIPWDAWPAGPALWGHKLSGGSPEGKSQIGVAANVLTDGRVRLKFSELINGRMSGPWALDPHTVTKALTGLPVPGFGMVTEVAMTDRNTVAILTFAKVGVMSPPAGVDQTEAA